MSESSQETTGLKGRYATRLSEDLDHNAKEQQRIEAEIATLQEQLAALREDQTLLMGLRQALEGSTPAAATAPADQETTPGPAPAVPRAAAGKAAAERRGTAGGGMAAATLGELARSYLQQRKQRVRPGRSRQLSRRRTRSAGPRWRRCAWRCRSLWRGGRSGAARRAYRCSTRWPVTMTGRPPPPAATLVPRPRSEIGRRPGARGARCRKGRWCGRAGLPRWRSSAGERPVQSAVGQGPALG